MPTTDERREVAARLRNAEIENIGLTYSAHLGEAIGECVRLVSGHEGLVEGGLNRLADLIEPQELTCRWEHIEGTWFVSECGKKYDRVVPDNYCPNCGARVVDA